MCKPFVYYETALLCSLNISISDLILSLEIFILFQFVLGVCKDRAASRYVSGGFDLERPVMTATHEYGTQNESTFPVSKPIMKITAPDLVIDVQ